MKDSWFNVAEITALMEAFSKNNIGKLELKAGDCSILLKQKAEPQAAASPQQQIVIAQQNAGVELPQAPGGNVVKSPIVGTYYAAPSPEDPPFVQVGSQVQRGDVLFIIESMKLMNEVLSECEGTVTQILVENAQAVEYGQPILCIE